MFERYRSSNLWVSNQKEYEVSVKVIDFDTGCHYGFRSIKICEFNPTVFNGYDVILPLVDIYFNGMLLKTGVYYYDYAGWIDEVDPPIVELA